MLVVVALFVIMTILTAACIVMPLVELGRSRKGKALLFFGVGLGFMFMR
jgi:hypothetical protein